MGVALAFAARRAISAALTLGRLTRADLNGPAPSPRFKEPGMSISLSHDSAHKSSEQSRFPGWRWVAVALAFPIAGLIGWTVGGRVDAVGAALVGGALTGAGLGAVQWWAAKGALGRAAAWIGVSAAGYACGLAAGAALVGYDTDLGALAVMGLVSGAVLGGAQGLVLARQGHRRLALPWAAAMPVLFALGWCATTGAGISVEDQFTVFGAYGAVVFMLLSGLLLSRFAPTRSQVA
jgi:hypothetical protein